MCIRDSIIIALAYPDPLHPTQWSWATGLFGVFAVCLFLRVCMRKVACVQKWYVYVALGGVFSWIVLLNARLHPALALAFVVLKLLVFFEHLEIKLCALTDWIVLEWLS